jgi:nitrate/TMAO reductase-like tetraheme cytochrome c subunit
MSELIGRVRAAVSQAFAKLGLKRGSPPPVRSLAILLGFVAAFGLVSAVLAIQVTSTPTFCGYTCHIMKPYYDTWRHSAHKNIACVECHIAPGVGAEMRKKIEALNMVVKYLTVTWGTNPWAEVSDAACLRCHERRLLEGSARFGVARFDHRPHLGEPKDGLQLRCTSCHAQQTKAQHMSVATNTCMLCHLKDQPANRGTGRCMLCHEIPDRLVKTAAGTTFDHRMVARQGLECSLCHGRVTHGSGEVPRERCLSCHNDPAALARYEEGGKLHHVHTVEHKIECVNCHLAIDHGKTAMVRAMHEPRGECSTCHGLGHDAQRDLFAGVGGRGLPPMPGPMYTAGVTCGGCHNADASPPPVMFASHSALTFRAGAVSCLSCHGEGYDRVLQNWKGGIDSRVTALESQLRSTAPAMTAKAPPAWEDAVHNVRLVADGHAVHNINYAYALLDQARTQMNAARVALGLAALPAPWKEVAAGAKACITCHQGVEQQSGAWRDRTFRHEPHVVSAKLACGECHRPHNERPASEVVRFGDEGCLSCHHERPARRPEECTPCHADPLKHTVPSLIGPFSHGAHRKAGLECGECHSMQNGDPRTQRAQCKSCHEQI